MENMIHVDVLVHIVHALHKTWKKTMRCSFFPFHKQQRISSSFFREQQKQQFDELYYVCNQ